MSVRKRQFKIICVAGSSLQDMEFAAYIGIRLFSATVNWSVCNQMDDTAFFPRDKAANEKI
jgi:hypothetical protein